MPEPVVPSWRLVSRDVSAYSYLNIVARLGGKAGRNAIACTSFIFQQDTMRVTLEINRHQERERERRRKGNYICYVLLCEYITQGCRNDLIFLYIELQDFKNKYFN